MSSTAENIAYSAALGLASRLAIRGFRINSRGIATRVLPDGVVSIRIPFSVPGNKRFEAAVNVRSDAAEWKTAFDDFNMGIPENLGELAIYRAVGSHDEGWEEIIADNIAVSMVSSVLERLGV